MICSHEELSNFLNNFSLATQAKLFRKFGYAQASAGYFRVRGGMPAIIAYDFMRSNKINFGTFQNYWLLLLNK